MIKKGQEQKNLKNNGPEYLFDFRFSDEPVRHKYQVVIPFQKRGSNLEYFSVWSDINFKLFQVKPHPQEFDKIDFLNYQYDNYKGDKEHFINEFIDIMYTHHDIFKTSQYVMGGPFAKRVEEWVQEKRQSLSESAVQLPSAIAHKVLTLHELGVIDFLRDKYFSTDNTDRDYNDEAKLISAILSIPNIQTVRKAISGITSKGKDNIRTKPAIQEVVSFLAKFGIPSK